MNRAVIRAFRATDDPDACRKYLEGHRRVLEAHGVKKVSSASNDWMENPSVYVVSVEDTSGERVLGGSRIHAADGVHPLPFELATGYMDPKIYERVHASREKGAAEICGLWNSVEVAGLGIGSYFATRAAVCVVSQLGIRSIWALCAPYTIRWSKRLGYDVVTELGKDGTFYYPKLNLLATIVLNQDTEDLSAVRPHEQEKIEELKDQPDQVRVESPPGKRFEVEIDYRLRLNNLELESPYAIGEVGPREPWPFEDDKEFEQLPEF